MVTYGGMSKKPITISTSSFIFKVSFKQSNMKFKHYIIFWIVNYILGWKKNIEMLLGFFFSFFFSFFTGCFIERILAARKEFRPSTI